MLSTRRVRALPLAPILAAAFLFAPARAAVSLYMTPEDVAARAVLAVEGTVVSVASGYDPETGRLATYVTLEPTFVHRGPAEPGPLVLREPGGRFGDLVHELDAVPSYTAGEEVFVFLEPARDGALRTAGRFFGKYARRPGLTRDADRAVRDLSGQGTILRRPGDGELEEIPLRDLAAAVAGNPAPASRPAWHRVPPEYGRLLWDAGAPPAGGATLGTASRGAGTLAAAGPGGTADPGFAPIDSTNPVRWTEPDSGASIPVGIEPARNPLNDPAGAVAEMKRAMAAWSNVPEARVLLQSSNDNDTFTSTNPSSPADAYPPRSIILFGDPYADITDPSGCSGTLAIGGYWRSGTAGSGGTVNNRTFYKGLRLYVIFNNGFECFLGNKDNLAEVATHELGHGLGFGHSTVADAIMRSSAYGSGRGPRLGSDDRDGAHCHYPHTLAVTSPNGGESWTAGSVHPITWTATAEWGADPGTVDLQWSPDAGSTWSSLVTGTANDGSWSWTVPSSPGSSHRVRAIRPNLVSPTPAPYPSACSLDPSDATFTIAAAAAAAGTSPATLQVSESSGTLTVTWGASCSSGATDYALYEGTLPSLRAGSWDHAAVTCSGGTDLSHTFAPGAGDRYYLVAPRTAGNEGRLGKGSSGLDRPASASACAPREASSCP